MRNASVIIHCNCMEKNNQKNIKNVSFCDPQNVLFFLLIYTFKLNCKCILNCV